MESLETLLLDVWREACRHIRIEESTVGIAEILCARTPVGQILVRRLDPSRSCLETVAIGFRGAESSLLGAPSQCTAEQYQAVLDWCEQGEMLLAGGGGGLAVGVARHIIPAGLKGDMLAGPLRDGAAPSGILLLEAGQSGRFAPVDRAMLETLLEPFSVALENDRRIREMASLREAAEADRTSLLSRLGRQALGDTIVGEDSGLLAVMQRVELVSKSDVPVLIFGETGTGKELVARAIHARSSRHAGPFMRVNCGAIPTELIDSQLFGHEKGSFTGAADTRHGWFERADRGTLFLDEIGELPAAAQVRLLRVLQDGMFERVGGQQPITVDVRIVAATHRDLSAMVREGQFREDLWYRLAVFPMDLPPLRERRQDIPAIARHFAQRAAVRFGLTPQMPGPECIELLLAYPWPGNVRELASVMDRAAILGDGHCLEVAKALGVQSGPAPLPAPTLHCPEPVPDAIVPLDDAIRAHIERGLEAAKGRIEGPQGAAQLLAINPHTLRARMRKLGIDWSKYRGG
jgi:transcriptional regulator with GAF, ATPase, and Fis domain